MTHDLIMPVLMARETQMQKVAKSKYIYICRYITDKVIVLKAIKKINYNQSVR